MKLLEIPRRQRGFKKLLQQQKKKYNIKEILSKEKVDTEQWEYKKPRLYNK